MALQNTNLVIQASPLPAAFKGDPNDFLTEIIRRMKIVSPSGTNFIFTGDVEPTSNVGPWLRGDAWWVFDTVTKRYVPLDISDSETRWFQVGNTTPTTASPPVWLKTTANATQASPQYGTPIAWYLYDGTAWIRLPVLLENRSVTQAILDWTANFYAVASGVDTYSATIPSTVGFTYGDGAGSSFFCIVKFSQPNSGASTLNVNSAGAKSIKKNVNQNLVAGEILAGAIHLLAFDGTNFQILTPLNVTGPVPTNNGGVAVTKGLLVKNDPANADTIFFVTSDLAVLQDVNGNSFLANLVDEQVDITGFGLGGLDTGAVLPSTWYYVWLVSNGNDVSAMFSLSSVVPTLPAGYTYYGLVGTARSDGTSKLIKQWQTDKQVFEKPTVLTTGFIGGSTFAFSLADSVPPIAKTASGSIEETTGGANVSYLAGDSNDVGILPFLPGNTFFAVPLMTSQSVYVTMSNAGTLNFSVSSFTI